VADFIGVAGLALILAGWSWEFFGVLKSRKAGIPFPFAMLYGAGSLMLTAYSIAIGDMVFVVLNAAATLIAVANALLSLVREREDGMKK
jgi:lipid-A-disaccharide synthase-like uncharacterized protein